MSKHRAPRSAQHRAKISANKRREWAERPDVMRRGLVLADQRRKVIFTAEMTATLLTQFWRGRHLSVIADQIGVSVSRLRAEVRSLNLPNRRHIPGFLRKGPYSRIPANDPCVTRRTRAAA